MTKFKKALAAIMTLCVCVSIFSLPVVAATETPKGEKDVVKTEQFTTTSTDEFHYDFAETIEENGAKYNLKSVDYKVLNSVPLQREETVVHTVDYKNRYGRDVSPAETVEIEKDGQQLTVELTDLEYTPTTITNRSEIVSAYTDFSYKTVTPEPAATKTITYHDEASGQDVVATLPFKELKEVDGWAWRSDVTIPIEFSLYDAAYYALGDKLIPYNDEKPALAGYETDLLNELGLDTDLYRITDVQWDGDPYYVGEVRYRKAIATGERYTANYIAVYESRVELPDVSGYNAVATYRNVVDVNSGEREYTVEATAVYEKDNIVTYAVIGAVLGVVFLALLVVAILYIISRRRANQTSIQPPVS
jgi:hypothetical protein